MGSGPVKTLGDEHGYYSRKKNLGKRAEQGSQLGENVDELREG